MKKYISLFLLVIGPTYGQLQYYPTIATGENVLVVYNENYTTDSDSNGVQDGEQIAKYYQTARNVPEVNMCAISCKVGSDYNEEVDSVVSHVNKKNRIIYYDNRYPVRLLTRPDIILDYFSTKGFIEKDAGDLKEWMLDQITNGVPESSLVIMSMGVVPDSVAEAKSDTCLIRKYMNLGGTVVWLGDKQFYYQGHSNGTDTEWGDSGSQSILGVRHGPNYIGFMATPTDSGINWGLKYPELGFKTVILDDVTFPLSICQLGDSTACSWIKNYNQQFLNSGFIRLRSDYYYGDNVERHKEITRTEYNIGIKDAIENYLVNNGIKNKIRYIVLTKGIPLKIYQENTTEYYIGSVLNRDQSSVDAALCLLFNENYIVEGMLPNPFEYSEAGAAESDWPSIYTDNLQTQRYESFSYSNRRLTLAYLVSRLDGYNVGDIVRMIDRSQYSNGIDGKSIVIDAQDSLIGLFGLGKAREFDDVFNNIGDIVLLDTTDNWIISSADSVIGYVSNGSNVGMPANYIIDTLDFNYTPGALFTSYESFNGYSFEIGCNYSGQGLVADFIHMGGTGAFANVYEPFTSGICEPYILFRSYVQGYNLVDSYYKSCLNLDWQAVVVGDPLCNIRKTYNTPFAPIDVVANKQNNMMVVSWDNNGQEYPFGCDVYRKRPRNDWMLLESEIRTNYVVDSLIVEDDLVYYKVQGVDTGGVKSPFTPIEMGSLDSIYFKEDFNQKEGDVNWASKITGTWAISNYRLIGGRDDSDLLLDCNLSDYRIDIDILENTPTVIVYLEYIDENNYIAAEIPEIDSLVVYEKLNGQNSILMSSGSSFKTKDEAHLNIYKNSDTLSVTYDTMSFITVCEFDLTGDKKGIGVRENRNRFDNYCIRYIGSKSNVSNDRDILKNIKVEYLTDNVISVKGVGSVNVKRIAAYNMSGKKINVSVDNQWKSCKIKICGVKDKEVISVCILMDNDVINIKYITNLY